MSSEENPGPKIVSDILKRIDSINSDNSYSNDTTILPPEDDLHDSDCDTHLVDSDDDVNNDAVDAANVLEFQEFLVDNNFFDDEVIIHQETSRFSFFTLRIVFFR